MSEQGCLCERVDGLVGGGRGVPQAVEPLGGQVLGVRSAGVCVCVCV